MLTKYTPAHRLSITNVLQLKTVLKARYTMLSGNRSNRDHQFIIAAKSVNDVFLVDANLTTHGMYIRFLWPFSLGVSTSNRRSESTTSTADPQTK
jgi:hypothetical protein